jgi:hypothetical protein
MDAIIAVGFGQAQLTRDGNLIWFEHDDELTAAQAEEIARKHPDHDWRIIYYGPLSEKEYQRQDSETWVLVRTGNGFA